MRRRLAALRQSFVTVSWVGNANPGTASACGGGEVAGTFDDADLLRAYGRVDRLSRVDWEQLTPALHDDDPADGESPALAARSAFVRLARNVRREGDELHDLSARLRRDTLRLGREAAIVIARLVRDVASAADSARNAGTPTVQDRWSALGTALERIDMASRDIGTGALAGSLAAVRAGASLRGFCEIARTTGELADILAAGWDHLEPQVAKLEDRAAETAAAATHIRALARAVHGCGKDITLLRIAAESGAAALSLAAADAPAGNLRQTVTDMEAAAGAVAASCDEMARTCHMLADHVMILVRETPVADRRGEPRYSTSMPVRIGIGSGFSDALMCDISSSGALVECPGLSGLTRGRPVALVIRETGTILGHVAGTSPRGIHITFDLDQPANAAVRRSILSSLGAIERGERERAERIHSLGREIRFTIERAIAEGALSASDVMGLDQPADSDSQPQLALRPTGPALADLLAPILAAATASGDIALAQAIDRTGRIAASSPLPETGTSGSGMSSGADMPELARPGDRTADPVLLHAARNLAPRFSRIVDAGMLDTRLDERLCLAAVPVFVAGRHWGCALMGFRLGSREPESIFAAIPAD